MNNKEIVESMQKAIDKFSIMLENNFNHNCYNKNVLLNKDDKGEYKEKNIIIYGPPGTGKTYGVNFFLDSERIDKNQRKLIQCHQNFKYDDFIEGIKPIGMSNSQLKLDIVSGEFKEFCIRAKTDVENKYFFIADEINRTNVSSMFGEILSLIEDDYRDNPYELNNEKQSRHLISTPLSNVIKARILDIIESEDKNELKKFIENNVYEIECGKEYILKNKRIYIKDCEENKSEENKIEINEIIKKMKENTNFEVKFGVPKNIIFIGMMNDVDKSIDSFDLALRRRFKWKFKGYDPDIIYKVIKDDKIKDYVNACNRLNYYITGSEKLKNDDDNKTETLDLGKSYALGHTYFLKIEQYIKKTITKDNKQQLFNDYLKQILVEYIRNFTDNEKELEEKTEKCKKVFINDKQGK